jgi:hypothetical protein
MRCTAGYNLLDHRRNENILQEWLNHVSRMEDIRYPMQLLLDEEDMDDH